MQPVEHATRATLHRLVAALVREGLAPGRIDDGALVVTLPAGTITTAVAGAPSLPWLRPADLRGAVHLGEAVDPDPREVLEAAEVDAPKARRRAVGQKLRSAVVHGTERWGATGQAPGPDAPASAWLRTVREGDPLDPAAGARTGWTARQTRAWDPACAEGFAVHRLAVSAARTRRVGGWSTRWLGSAPGGLVVLPVHPGAIDAVRTAMPSAQPLPDLRPAAVSGPMGQVDLEEVPGRTWLSVPVVRSPTDGLAAACQLGPIVRELAHDRLGVVADLGGVVVPGVTTAVVQETPEAIWPGDRFVTAAALEQQTPDGGLVLARLPGAERRLAWFSAWSGRLLDVTLPLLEQGIGVPPDPAHWWMHLRRGRLVGVVVQGWWAARVHAPTLAPHADPSGLDALAVPSRDALYAEAWHALVGRHLGRLVRLLELGPEGFRVVRDHLDRIVPEGTPLHQAFSAWVVSHPCALRSRLEGRAVVRDLPNPLA